MRIPATPATTGALPGADRAEGNNDFRQRHVTYCMIPLVWPVRIDFVCRHCYPVDIVTLVDNSRVRRLRMQQRLGPDQRQMKQGDLRQ